MKVAATTRINRYLLHVVRAIYVSLFRKRDICKKDVETEREMRKGVGVGGRKVGGGNYEKNADPTRFFLTFPNTL